MLQRIRVFRQQTQESSTAHGMKNLQTLLAIHSKIAAKFSDVRRLRSRGCQYGQHPSRLAYGFRSDVLHFGQINIEYLVYHLKKPLPKMDTVLSVKGIVPKAQILFKERKYFQSLGD